MTRRASLTSFLAAGLLVASIPASAQQLPAGFVRERIASFPDAIALAYIDEDRLLVGEQSGRVWFVDHDVKRNLVHDASGETSFAGDRGLLGLAVGPDFDLEGWIYLLLVVRVPGEGTRGVGYSRLLRVRAETTASGELVALPETRQVLLGESWPSGIPACEPQHALGSLRFLSDGSLTVATGDNAAGTDTGGLHPRCFLPGRTPLEQDIGALRAQSNQSPAGKILRVDPATGLGLPDNPFFSGDANDFASRVYARGFRNPFRTTTLPGTGPREALLIADVGWNDWEEVDLCLGGENFGWPCLEGPGAAPHYPGLAPGVCDGLVSSAPLATWHHSQAGATGFVGRCASALCVYTGQRYPAVYRGRLFFSDFERSWLRTARLGGLDQGYRIQDTLLFGSQMGSPVELVAQPGTGDLVYIARNNSSASVFRIRYVGNQQPPVAVAHATPSFGEGALDVTLSAEGSSDPDGQPLVYAWDLGDGTSAAGPAVLHHYPVGSAYTARLTVTDAEDLADSAEVRITPGNTPPRIRTLLAPRDGDTYVSDEALRVAAQVEDAEDGVPAGVHWSLDLVHDHHVHPGWSSAEGASAFLVPDSHGPGDNHFVVRLRVTDASGLEDERTLEIFDAHSFPQAHLVDLATNAVRVGQPLSPIGHVDYSLGRVAVKQPDLRWDWGDGTSTLVAGARHQVDSHPTHVYGFPGSYKLRLSAELDGRATSTQSATIQVARPWPAVAIFTPLDEARWIPRAEQEGIAAALRSALASRTSEVRVFVPGEGAALAAWIESLASDSIPDVLVLLDLLPAPLVAGGIPGSLLERWTAQGNGLVWSGYTPFQTLLEDDGTSAQTLLGADVFFGATAPFLVLGEGEQRPTPTGQSIVPSLASFLSSRALRTAQLGPTWHVARLFAQDPAHESDALELEHVSGHGFYAQFLCAEDTGLPRAAVLSEYLLNRLKQRASGTPGVAQKR